MKRATTTDHFDAGHPCTLTVGAAHVRVIVVGLIALAACTARAPAALPDVHSADQAIYRAVLDTMFLPGNSDRITQLVVVDSTSTYRLDGFGMATVDRLYGISGIDSAAIGDYQARNQQPHSLKLLTGAGLRVPVVLVTSESLRVLPGDDPEKYWDRFYRRFPHSGGSISLSAIGYSAKGDAALLMVSHGCGGLCGSGSIVVVRRDDGRWHVVSNTNLWMS